MSLLGKLFGKIGILGMCSQCKTAIKVSYLVSPPVTYDTLVLQLRSTGVLCHRACAAAGNLPPFTGVNRQGNVYSNKLLQSGVVCKKCQTVFETGFSLLNLNPDVPLTRDGLVHLLRRENLICYTCYQSFISTQERD